VKMLVYWEQSRMVENEYGGTCTDLITYIARADSKFKVMYD